MLLRLSADCATLGWNGKMGRKGRKGRESDNFPHFYTLEGSSKCY